MVTCMELKNIKSDTECHVLYMRAFMLEIKSDDFIEVENRIAAPRVWEGRENRSRERLWHSRITVVDNN